MKEDAHQGNAIQVSWRGRRGGGGVAWRIGEGEEGVGGNGWNI